MQTIATAEDRSFNGKTAGATAAPKSLDALLDLDAPVLETLYRNASVPKLEDVKGDLRGRMLAIPKLAEPFAALPRGLASSSRFPWRGKSFSPRDAVNGEGINRVVLDRFRLYRFETFIGPSRAGNFQALQLDYDLAENPFFIRAIKDEMRALSPGLYLGQAYIQVGERAPYLGLYFGLST